MPRSQRPRAAKAAGEEGRRSLQPMEEDQPELEPESSAKTVATRTRSLSPIKDAKRRGPSRRHRAEDEGEDDDEADNEATKETRRGRGRKSKKSQDDEGDKGNEIVIEELDDVEAEEDNTKKKKKKAPKQPQQHPAAAERRGREKVPKRKRGSQTAVDETDEDVQTEEDHRQPPQTEQKSERSVEDGVKRDFSYLDDLKILHHAHAVITSGQHVTLRSFNSSKDPELPFRLRNHGSVSCWNRYKTRLWRFLEAHSDYVEKAPILTFPECEGDMRDPMARLPTGTYDPALPHSRVPHLSKRQTFVDLGQDCELPALPANETLYEEGEPTEPVRAERYPLSPQGKVRTYGPDGKLIPLQIASKRRKIQQEDEEGDAEAAGGDAADQNSFEPQLLVLDDDDDDRSRGQADFQLPNHRQQLRQNLVKPPAGPKVPPMFWIENADVRNDLMKEQVQKLAQQHHVSTKRVLRAYILCNGRTSKMSQYLSNPLSVKIFSVEEDLMLLRDETGEITSNDMPRFTDTEIAERRAFLLSKSYT